MEEQVLIRHARILILQKKDEKAVNEFIKKAMQLFPEDEILQKLSKLVVGGK